MTAPRNFTKVPNDVLLDVRLSPHARLAYAVLIHLAWQAGRRRETDAVKLDALGPVAEAIGCSRTALKARLTELRHCGLLFTKRVQHGMLYVLFDASIGADSDLKERAIRADSALELGRIPAQYVRARSLSEVKTTTEDKNPPALVRVDGRNLPLDALCEACGIDPAGPRIAQAIVALEGRGASQGIRHLYWLECTRVAEAHDDVGAEALAALSADPERFTRLLAEKITAKVAAILERDRWRSSLAPSHVLDLWLDIELRPLARAGTLTPDQMEHFDG